MRCNFSLAWPVAVSSQRNCRQSVVPSQCRSDGVGNNAALKFYNSRNFLGLKFLEYFPDAFYDGDGANYPCISIIYRWQLPTLTLLSDLDHDANLWLEPRPGRRWPDQGGRKTWWQGWWWRGCLLGVWCWRGNLQPPTDRLPPRQDDRSQAPLEPATTGGCHTPPIEFRNLDIDTIGEQPEKAFLLLESFPSV